MEFPGSKLREPTGSEGVALVRVGECLGFFVENSGGLALIATARHCIDFKAQEWCDAQSEVRDLPGNIHRCKRIVAGDTKRDAILFELAGGPVPAPDRTLRMAEFAPPENAKITQWGLGVAEGPRPGKVTISDGCAVFRGAVKSPNLDGKSEDACGLHDCTTTTGNAGGPVLLEKTRIAIGMAWTYIPAALEERDPQASKKYAYFSQFAEFVKQHRPVLEEAGVVFAKDPADDAERPQPAPTPSAPPSASVTPGN